MKNLLSLLILLGMILSVAQVQAQATYRKNKNNYFVLTRKVEQLKPILLAAGSLAEADGKKYGEFHVVICGQTVRDLLDGKKMQPFLDLAETLDVKLFACGFSLKKFAVDPAALPVQMEVVDNGILYGLTLQKDGFYSITL